MTRIILQRGKLVLLALLTGSTMFLPTYYAQKKPPARATKTVDDKALKQVETRTDDWLTHGRDYAETRYSPLNKITATNIKQLGLAWSFDTNTNRGLEATPLVVDGVMYTTGSWSVVYALDARTGQRRWQYDPQVPRTYGAKACCDVVNRGVAVYKGKVYVGTLDGRLVALNADTGKVVWSTVTVDQQQAYTITGAPRVVKGKVIIGNGGGEFGVRGYVAAYDAETGKQAWRFYVVPGDPSKPFESKALEKAAATWTGEWWKTGGGGTVWDSLAYDPELDLLYVGTGNGSPWQRDVRSPKGGDNLYLSSIVALRPDTGAYVWHYQTTPGDTWDFTATQHMILADLNLNGRARKVLMQAPKNGFFYVLDRATGELLSAEPFVAMSWAKGVDKETGRPLEMPNARFKSGYSVLKPGPLGAHNWQPMSYNPNTGLVYIPAQDAIGLYLKDGSFKYVPNRPGLWNTGIDFVLSLKDPPRQQDIPPGHLLAWDPVKQKEVWRVQYKTIWNGGTLTTAGNLVIQGTADGRVVAYSADKGELLWEFNVGIGVIGSPVTYQVDGVQYIALMAGWGGAFPLTGGYAAIPDINVKNVGRVLTFALGGKQTLAELPRQTPSLTPIESKAEPGTVTEGQMLYAQWCGVCHGLGAIGGGGVLPGLPFSKPDVFAMYKDIVLDGSYANRGMPGFKSYLSPEDVEAIRAYIIQRRAEIASGK